MSEENVNSSELEHEKALKGEMGAVAAGAVPLDEKHEAKKDPEHADSHKIEEGLSSTFSTGGAVIQEFSSECHKEPGRSGIHIHVNASFPKGGKSSVGGFVRGSVEKEETKEEAEEAEGNHEKKET